jgi:hypothetical protein
MGILRTCFDFVFKSGLEEGFWSTVKWVLFAKIGGVTVVDIIVGYLAWGDLKPWQLILVLLFVSLIVIWLVNGVVFYLFPIWRSRKQKTAVQAAASQSEVEFLDRRELDRKYPAHDFLKYGNDVYLCWVSGQGVLTRNPKQFLESKCIKIFLLPDPQSDYIKMLWDSVDNREQYNMAQQIKNMTREARKYGVPVRWVRSYIGTNITVVNPDRADGYVNLEPTLPTVEPDYRKTIHIRKPTHEADILGVFEIVKKIWENDKMSYEPPHDL